MLLSIFKFIKSTNGYLFYLFSEDESILETSKESILANDQNGIAIHVNDFLQELIDCLLVNKDFHGKYNSFENCLIIDSFHFCAGKCSLQETLRKVLENRCNKQLYTILVSDRSPQELPVMSHELMEVLDKNGVLIKINKS